MILWTAMPLELVLGDYDPAQTTPSPQVEVKYKDRTVIIEPLGLNKGKVLRLISTDPADYLLEDFQPGMVISLG